MGRRFEPGALNAAWRALAGGSGDGWRTILVATLGSIRVHAGRRSPADEESVEFRVPEMAGVPGELPEGRGFEMTRVKGSPDTLMITRRAGASPTLFLLMVTDVLTDLDDRESNGEPRLASALVARVRAWQDFMERADDGVLGREAEIGLLGELTVLAELIRAGMVGRRAVESWAGPSGGLHDFHFGGPALEVKTSTSSDGFAATIDSLDQLDDSFASPLYLAAVSLRSGQGRTLAEFVAEVDDLLSDDGAARQVFERCLLRAGFLRAAATRYSNRYSLRSTSLYLVDDAFPRLVRATVPQPVLSARYRLDLGGMKPSEKSLSDFARTIPA